MQHLRRETPKAKIRCSSAFSKETLLLPVFQDFCSILPFCLIHWKESKQRENISLLILITSSAELQKKKKPSFFLTLASLNDEASPEEEDLTPEYQKKNF